MAKSAIIRRISTLLGEQHGVVCVCVSVYDVYLGEGWEVKTCVHGKSCIMFMCVYVFMKLCDVRTHDSVCMCMCVCV